MPLHVGGPCVAVDNLLITQILVSHAKANIYIYKRHSAWLVYVSVIECMHVHFRPECPCMSYLVTVSMRE
jgi:hypothetical protein